MQEDGGVGEIPEKAENPAQEGLDSGMGLLPTYFHCWCLKVSWLYHGPSQGEREYIPCLNGPLRKDLVRKT